MRGDPGRDRVTAAVRSGAAVGKAGVGVHPVPEHVDTEPRHGSGMLHVTFFKQPERLIFVAETRINSAKLIKIDFNSWAIFSASSRLPETA